MMTVKTMAKISQADLCEDDEGGPRVDVVCEVKMVEVGGGVKEITVGDEPPGMSGKSC
jgi:hypothetical protein